MSITHRPHLPRRGIAGIIHRHRRADGEPTIEIEPVTDESIHAWLTSGDRQLTAPEQRPAIAPAAHVPNTGPEDLAGVARMPFTVYTELDDDEAFAARLLAMERDAHSVADFLAADFDARMEKLLARSRRSGNAWGTAVSLLERGWEATEALLASVRVTRRRKAAITPLVLNLGELMELGDVSMESASVIVLLRSRYLSATEMPSQRIPKLTDELLAAMDAEREVAA